MGRDPEHRESHPGVCGLVPEQPVLHVRPHLPAAGPAPGRRRNRSATGQHHFLRSRCRRTRQRTAVCVSRNLRRLSGHHSYPAILRNDPAVQRHRTPGPVGIHPEPHPTGGRHAAGPYLGDSGQELDYYFFDENCAYRLLALIDAARPGTDLLDEVSTHAIPSDTVRWVRDAGLVESIHYRPSAATSVAHSLDSLPPEHRTIAAAVANGYVDVNGPEVRELEKNDRAQLLDATYDYVRYQSEAEGWPREHAAPLSHQLLVSRSQIDGAEELPKVPEPDIRDDQGHDTFRLSLGSGQMAHSEFTQLTLRPAYHDVLDPPAGYRTGAQLQFLRLDARIYHDNDEL